MRRTERRGETRWRRGVGRGGGDAKAMNESRNEWGGERRD